MVMTTKIKELRYFKKFNEVFVLSLMILFINLIARVLFQVLANGRIKIKQKMRE